MFKRILIPTDGSELSARAVKAGIELASTCHATIHAFHVAEPPPPMIYAGPVAPVSDADYEEEALQGLRAAAERYLAEVRSAAVAAGVICDVSYAFDRRPYAAILQTAQERHCDLIVMGSHGRRGLGLLLQGSETQKVISHGSVPVLIYH
ncbi:universal stress protein [Frateuria aurantia]|uniref:Universal stress protein UspA-like protein n=1 Tax=Frateuria aurantia (strain ATCC 33424 / DSM 6220 / KCTC 2777 / LMG 1558 / NBRC 3245 / NCIMB 13370) TaxID=767434 RepID=H8L0J7_FRAAD|nr:universal stress protein [Frateuria aurantia]AFC84623.1 universal stress protein UspA-like protein [Frateuria aurantia DSM 6220]